VESTLSYQFPFQLPALSTRIAVGVAIFAALAIVDLRRHGKQATRWREYAFLLICVAVAMLYGIVNDQLTCFLSWEYFYYGKELSPILGPQTPPATLPLHIQAARIGILAAWSAGVIIGVALLLANNPSQKLVQLPYPRLLARLPIFILITATCAAITGIAGYFYLLNWMEEDFRNLAATNLWHPHHFMLVYGIHLGGYIGSLLGLLYSVASIRKERRLKTHSVMIPPTT